MTHTLFTRGSVAVCVALATLFAKVAVADESRLRDRPQDRDRSAELDDRAPPPRDLSAAGYFGARAGTSLGVLYGASLEYRGGPLVVGGLIERGAEFFTSSYTGAAGAIGFAARPTRNFRYEALGIGGVHFYRTAEYTDRLPYASVRGVATYLPGPTLNHFEFGVYLDLMDDLSRAHRVYGTFGPPATDHAIGFLSVGLGLQMGLAHDFL